MIAVGLAKWLAEVMRTLWFGSLRSLIQRAEQGNVEAQHDLGQMYGLGDGVPQDYQKARYWIEKAAEQGHAKAQFNLGGQYEQGLGVQKDYQKSLYWYEKAAEQGNVSAQYNIGLLYFEGLGVDKDYEKVLYWHLQAAEQGHAKAQNSLGSMYGLGLGATQDREKAKYWLDKAAKQGHSHAKASLDALQYEDKADSGEYLYQQEVSQLIEYDAEQGDAKAKVNLGGDGMALSVDIATIEKAAAQGDANAQFVLAVMYLEGDGVAQDYQQARGWFEKAAMLGVSAAQRLLGFMYFEGKGVPQDYQKARAWFEKAAEQGNEEAQAALGRIYLLTHGVDQDNQKGSSAHYKLHLIAAILLLASLLPMPYGFYTLLRLFVTLASGITTFTLFQANKNSNLLWLFILIALVYNPFIPVDLGPTLDKGTWSIINIVTAFIFLSVKK